MLGKEDNNDHIQQRVSQTLYAWQQNSNYQNVSVILIFYLLYILFIKLYLIMYFVTNVQKSCYPFKF